MDKLKTIDIKGKPYVLVNERVREFRNRYRDKGQMLTELFWRCVMMPTNSFKDEITIDNETYFVDARYTTHTEKYIYGADADGNRGEIRIDIDVTVVYLKVGTDEHDAVYLREGETGYYEIKEKVIEKIKEGYYGEIEND